MLRITHSGVAGISCPETRDRGWEPMWTDLSAATEVMGKG
jgi:hypothetical protein